MNRGLINLVPSDSWNIGCNNGLEDFDVSLKSGHGEQRDYNKLNYNQFEVSNHEKENI